MTEQTKPVLLTESEWRKLLAPHPFIDDVITAIALKGLISPEPVDPLLVEAWKVVGQWAEYTFGRDSSVVAHYSSNKVSEDTNTRLALAALKRGREIGLAERPQITREMVREALRETNRQLGFADIAISEEYLSLLTAALEPQQ